MLTGDLSFTEDLAAGAWVAPLLTGEFGAVTLTVPSGYPAYVRICHPARDVNDMPVDWSTVARTTGRTRHALMQWHALVGSPDPFDFTGSLWPGGPPDRGNLATDLLQSVCDLLGAHTGDAAECFAAVRSGWSGVEPGHAGLRLPGREYVLLRGPLQASTQIGVDRPFWQPQSPNLLWPRDRAWCLASEIDFDSTLVGGTKDLIEALLAEPGLEAWPVAPEDSLAANGDRVNHAPSWPRSG